MAITGFSKSLVLLAINLSWAAYSGASISAAAGREIMKSTTNDVSKPVFYVREIDSCLYIIIRGSKTEKDFATDSTWDEVKTSVGTLHKGFYEAASYVLSKVQTLINGYSGTIYITGHSYGGAVASVLYVLARAQDQKHDINCIAFGPPPMMDVSVAGPYKDKLAVFVNDADIIPTLSIPNIVDKAGLGLAFIKVTPTKMLVGIIHKLLEIVRSHPSDLLSNCTLNSLNNAAPKVVGYLKEYAKGKTFSVEYLPGNVYKIGTGETDIQKCKVNAAKTFGELSVTEDCLSDHEPSGYSKAIKSLKQ